MKWKIFLSVLIALLIGIVMVSVIGLQMGAVIGIIVFLAVVFAGTAHMLKSGEDGRVVSNGEKKGYEHQKDVRATSLGCYGPEAEEEKFSYEQTPPEQSK